MSRQCPDCTAEISDLATMCECGWRERKTHDAPRYQAPPVVEETPEGAAARARARAAVNVSRDNPRFWAYRILERHQHRESIEPLALEMAREAVRTDPMTRSH